MPDPNQTQTQDPWSVVEQTPAPPPQSATQNPVTAIAQPSDPWAVISQAPAPTAQKPESGVWAGVKRNSVDALTGLYHAFNDPATEQEKQELLSKIREQNAKGDKIPEDLATNPSRATMALHRIVDAPADVLAKKGRDEVTVAKDLINHHEYWKGGNLYLSGLADKVSSAVPLVGPAINSIAERGEGALVPAIDKQGNTLPVSDVPAERKDFSGAATDVGTLVALEHAPTILKAGSDVAGKAVSKVGETAKSAAEAIKPESLTKRPETPQAQHGTPIKVESPLDGPTVGKQLGGKDLSQEALNTLQGHVGDKIPVGSTAKNALMKAVEPVAKTIADTASKMNDVVRDAEPLKSSVFQDGKIQSDIEGLKKNLPPSVRDGLAKDVDGVMLDADEALKSNDPVHVLEQRRILGRQIDWDKIEKNPSTPSEVQNLARVKVYKALGDKIHAEIPGTLPLDKVLQPNLELRSHMTSKLGERVVGDPHAATVEAQSEFKKGQIAIENAAHNEAVTNRWSVIGTTLRALGYGTLGGEILKHLVP